MQNRENRVRDGGVDERTARCHAEVQVSGS